LIRSVATSDLVMFGGGGILQDETSLRNFVYYSLIAILAILFRKRVIFLGSGFGPVRKKLSKILMKILARSKRVVFFPRDVVSESYLSKLGGIIRSGTDLSIGYIRRFRFERNGKTAVIVPRSERGWEDIEDFLRKLGFDVKVFLADPKDSVFVNVSSFSFGLGIKEIASASLVISERFHPALVAAYFEIPFVSIGKKSSRFFRRYLPGYPGVLENPSDLDARKLVFLRQIINLSRSRMSV